MFAGVSSIILSEDNSVVLGISSREGEEVQLQCFFLSKILKVSEYGLT